MRVLLMRLKEYFYIPLEWLSIISSIINSIFIVLFWKTISNLAKILSFEDFMRFSFYYFSMSSFIKLFTGLIPAVEEDIRSGKISQYLLYPRNFFIFLVFRYLEIPFGDLTSALLFLFILKFKITPIEALLLIYSSLYIFLK